MFIEIKKANKQYGSGETAVKALDNVDLSIEKGKIYVILGPSGSGKSTLMNMLGGIDTLTSGSITVDGRNISSANKKELTQYRQEDVGFVFQFYNLIADLTVQENVEVVSDISEHPLNIDEVLTALDIAPYRKRFPKELSGGQQQRVAIARALVKMPKVLLLDEPLSNLDARLRLQTREELRRIQCETKITTVFVTHDQEEAMSISDMIIVMKEGVIQQIGKPQEVYDNPANLFVAKFLGTPPINVFRGQVKDHTIYIGKDAILKAGNVPDQEVWVGIRPEGFILNENGALHCNLSRIEVMGRDVSVVSTKEESENATIRSIISAENSVDTGSLVVSFDLKPNKVFLFHKDTQERIPYTGS